MSTRFKSQDYFRYKKLGKKWRKPKGHQSKMRRRKGGSGPIARIGHGSPRAGRAQVRGFSVAVVRSMTDLEKTATKAVFIGGTVGAKKAALIAARATELGLTIINMKTVHRANAIGKAIAKKKADAMTTKEKAHEATAAKEKGARAAEAGAKKNDTVPAATSNETQPAETESA